MRRFWRCCLALVLLTVHEIQIFEGVAATPGPPSTAHSTCATGSVNWITQTLPQQCLRTSWVSSNASFSGNNTVSPTPRRSLGLGNASVEDGTLTATRPVHDVLSDTIEDGESASTSNETQRSEVSASRDKQQPAPAQDSSTQVETEADSALQSTNFLSFEEWKKQKLGDTGQSPEALSKVHSATNSEGQRQRPGTALDTLGEDSEIDLDFTGFGAANKRQDEPTQQYEVASAEADPNASPSSGPSAARSKDAGRTCKERFNYASFDCAANVLKTNARCKSSSAVLVENKDSYMLNECSMDNKFLIVELCEYIQIDTVVLANFEFFSSMFRTFRISVSDRYPVKIDKWQVLGVYEARNSREIQAFLVENPLIWAKYIRIEFLTQYGNEYYCPLSLLRVHGTTMMEDYRHQEELASGQFDNSDEDIEIPNEAIAVPAISGNVGIPEAIITPLSPEEAAKSISASEAEKGQSIDASHSPQTATQSSTSSQASPSVPSTELQDSVEPTKIAISDGQTTSLPSSSSSYPQPDENSIRNQGQGSIDLSMPANASADSISSSPLHIGSPSVYASHSISAGPSAAHGLNFSTKTSSAAIFPASADATSGTPRSQSGPINQQSAGPASTSASDRQANVSMPMSSGNKATATASTNISSTANQLASTVPASTQPATQESFFKTLSKRLALLESNATLSLQYIESQSMLLRDAFTSVEKRQIAKTASFLANLNETVLRELTAARADYDQLWQSTVLELSHFREEGRREREVLNEQIRLLAEEVVGQRRLMAVQVAVVLIVLGLFLFTKAVPGQASDTTSSLGMGEIRILQGMQALMARGRSAKHPRRPRSPYMEDENRRNVQSPQRFSWDSPLAGSPNGTRPTTGHGMDEKHEDAWDDLLAFVDENVRPRQRGRVHAAEQYLKQKPLPPAPQSDLVGRESETGDSGELDDSSETNTPLLGQRVDHTHDHEVHGSIASQRQNLLGVSGRLPIERGLAPMRAAKSAPTTPRVEGSPILDDAVGSRAYSPGDSGVSDTGSIGLGIEVDGV